MPDSIALRPDDIHNRVLGSRVHPADWINPGPPRPLQPGGHRSRHRRAGCGGGGGRVGSPRSTGREASDGRRLSELRLRAVEGPDPLGGAGRGRVRDAAQFGVEVPPGVRVNFPVVMERMRRLRAEISPNDSAARFRQLGVDIYFGEGRFTGRETIEVGGKTLRFRKAVIATGARAAEPPIAGLAEAGFLTNETIFSLTELPQRLAVIGAGPIGCEMAQAFARFGSRVSLLEAGRGILPREDRDAAERLERALARDGVEVRLGCRIVRVAKGPGGKSVQLEQDGRPTELEVDEILVGVGRMPNVEGLSLEAAGIDFDPHSGVHVNDRLQTGNPRVFAAGDICSRFKFTHAADAMARIVIRNALFLGRAQGQRLDDPVVYLHQPGDRERGAV